MSKLLIVVDYQNDFVLDNGKLTAGKAAQNIEAAIVEKINNYKASGENVVFIMDGHEEEDWSQGLHIESKAFPRHSIKGTDGYNLTDALKNICGDSPVVDKRAYCPDFNKEPIKSLVDLANEFEVCGLVTDICVFQTVIGLYTYLMNNKKSAQITVDAKACSSFNPDKEAPALAYLRDILQVNIIE